MPFTRLPAIPLIVNDPYFSIWSPADVLTDAQTMHWCKQVKPLYGHCTVDGTVYRFLGEGAVPAMRATEQEVTPTTTRVCFEAEGVQLTARFVTPLLPDDLELLSTPVTLLDYAVASVDGASHQVTVDFAATDTLCYDGQVRPDMTSDQYELGGMNVAYVGQARQRPLSHSGDHITIDWGYLYLASRETVHYADGEMHLNWKACVSPDAPASARALIAYDDIASILYYGTPCKAWYARNGKTLTAALVEVNTRFDKILAACEALDRRVLADARAVGGEDYALICAASWRHAIAAHKLIATPAGEMALLSKENDSNGCIGTVDVSYPSIPLFLKYRPELVDALSRPVLEFASMPVWRYDYAPHDVGRYPIVNGQVYACKAKRGENGVTYPPYYLYPASASENAYDPRYQMPVEECGNMLVMLYAAARETGDWSLSRKYRTLLENWVKYLIEFGPDPGNQLCTDDFAGHLARNINLSAKAIIGIACYARILEGLGEDGRAYATKAREMAESWRERAQGESGTYLTFDKVGWSMKYNLVWDLVMGFQLIPQSFYEQETRSYVARIDTYGLPLDSRATYTKSDWILWIAAMAQDESTRAALIAPVARYLRETQSRVPFSDWYDVKTGRYQAFIARSVQGGVFMPMLTAK